MVPLVLLIFCNREGENQPPIKRSICICSLKPLPGITLLVIPGPAGNVLASQHPRAARLGSATPGLRLDEIPAATGAQPVLIAPWILGIKLHGTWADAANSGMCIVLVPPNQSSNSAAITGWEAGAVASGNCRAAQRRQRGCNYCTRQASSATPSPNNDLGKCEGQSLADLHNFNRSNQIILHYNTNLQTQNLLQVRAKYFSFNAMCQSSDNCTEAHTLQVMLLYLGIHFILNCGFASEIKQAR